LNASTHAQQEHLKRRTEMKKKEKAKEMEKKTNL
jgi:hypothetical protein